MADTADRGASTNESEGGLPETAARRRRRMPVKTVAICGLILWLIGDGMGWIGSGPRGEHGDRDDGGQGANAAGSETGGDGEAGEPVTAQLAHLRGGTDGSGEATAADPGATGDPVVAGTGPTRAPEKAPQKVPEKTAATAAASALAEDRFRSLMSLIDSHIEQAELGEAAGIVKRLQALSLTAAQQRDVTAAQKRLEPLRAAAEERVLAHVKKGEVLAADRVSKDLLVAGAWHVGALAVAAPELALGADWQRPLARRSASIEPQPLPRNRRVRMQWRDALQVGTVANVKGEQVTVQVRSGTSQSFPTVRVSQCEPTDSNYDEAIEMGLYAVRAGAPRLARLWLLRAHLLRQEISERGQQLLDLLR